MRQSERLGLWLPEGSDPLDISKLRENFETLDPLGGGLEAIREGTGPGSLFMVSKHYKGAVRNAVLCNGGTVDGGAYPELADVIGVKYGGTVSTDSMNAQYGITSPYPNAYNADMDLYVHFAAPNYYITLYRENEPPAVVHFASNMPTSAAGTPIKDCEVISFGHFVFIKYTYTQTSGSAVPTAYRYDLNANTWASVGQTGGDPNFDDFLFDAAVDAGEGVLVPAPVYGKSSQWALAHKATGLVREVKFSLSSGENAAKAGMRPVRNLDDPEHIYILLSNADAASIVLYRLSPNALSYGGSGVLDVTVELVKTLPKTYSGSTFVVSGGVICGGFLFAVNGLNLLRCSLDSASPSWTSAYKASSSSSLGPYPRFAKKITAGVGLLCFSAGSTAFLVDGGAVSAYSFYTMNGLGTPFLPAPGTVLTTSGVRGNFKMAGVKLPTITMSEALVYMRTGAAGTE